MLDVELYLPFVPVALYAMGALVALVDRRPPGRMPHVAAIIASLFGLVVACRALLAGTTYQLAAFSITPFASFAFALDSLFPTRNLAYRGRSVCIRDRLRWV